ncbi:MAG: ATP-binding cassette domain-containing protein, partial [Pseudolabrys sp.]
APGRPVLRHLSLRIDADDRIALLGANGNGKSTLVKLLAGRLQPEHGTVTRAAALKVAYFAQHQLDELNESASAYDHVRALMPDAPEAAVRTRVGTIGFSGEAADTKVAKLSGGEKARLMLALATFDAPHLLILDEPTNHLDIDSRSALIEAIADYPGATILVSHDRHLLDACADRLLLVADGAVRPFDGDLDDYRRRVLSERNDDGKAAKSEKQKDPRLTPEDARKLAAQKRESAKELRQRVTRAQTTIDKQTQAIAKLDDALADGTLFARDPTKAATFAKERAAAADALAAAEEEWLEASEAYETAMA